MLMWMSSDLSREFRMLKATGLLLGETRTREVAQSGSQRTDREPLLNKPAKRL